MVFIKIYSHDEVPWETDILNLQNKTIVGQQECVHEKLKARTLSTIPDELDL